MRSNASTNCDPDELSSTMSRTDLLALDRVTKVINAPIIRSLPFVRSFRSRKSADTPEERVSSTSAGASASNSRSGAAASCSSPTCTASSPGRRFWIASLPRW